MVFITLGVRVLHIPSKFVQLSIIFSEFFIFFTFPILLYIFVNYIDELFTFYFTLVVMFFSAVFAYFLFLTDKLKKKSLLSQGGLITIRKLGVIFSYENNLLLKNQLLKIDDNLSEPPTIRHSSYKEIIFPDLLISLSTGIFRPNENIKILIPIEKTLFILINKKRIIYNLLVRKMNNQKQKQIVPSGIYIYIKNLSIFSDLVNIKVSFGLE